MTGDWTDFEPYKQYSSTGFDVPGRPSKPIRSGVSRRGSNIGGCYG